MFDFARDLRGRTMLARVGKTASRVKPLAAFVLFSIALPHVTAADETNVKNFAAGYVALTTPSSVFLERLGAMASRLHGVPATEDILSDRETKLAALELAARFSGSAPSSAPSEAVTAAVPVAVATAEVATVAPASTEALAPAQAAASPRRFMAFASPPMGLGAALPVDNVQTAPAPALDEPFVNKLPTVDVIEGKKGATAASGLRLIKKPRGVAVQPSGRERGIGLADRAPRAVAEVLPWRRSRSEEALSQHMAPMTSNCIVILTVPCPRNEAFCGC